jgi:predicted dehydrogenase
MLNVAIIGAGLIGHKRAAALGSTARLVAVADIDSARASQLAVAHGAEATADWREAVRRSDVEAVIVATTNDIIPVCAQGALEAGKHVLIEKPGGRFAAELHALGELARARGLTLSVGFNHRFHPAFREAHALMAKAALGPLLYIRARYGHGGRLGYEKEWRADPRRSGGGELLDQGVHLIDLCRWLGGEFDLEWGTAETFFWNMPVEDNGFLFLRSRDGKAAAQLHASCTEWKNLFDFEIFCRDGKIQIWGLGRSYGVEELRVFRMKPEMGPPDVEVRSYPGEDESWPLEFAAFRARIMGEASMIATASDGARALEIVQSVYNRSPVASRGPAPGAPELST